MASTKPPVCEICNHRQITTPAIIWCNDCEEGLCGDCRDHHSISRGTRTHDTITINDYQSLPRDVVSTRHSCEKYEENFITFCRTHDCPCCKKCVILNHKECDNVIDINDVIGNIKSSALFQEAERNLNSFVETLEIVLANTNQNMEEIKLKKNLLKIEINTLRRKLQSYLDKIYNKLVQELNDTEQTTLKELQLHATNIEMNMNEAINEKEKLGRIKQYASNLQAFVFVKKIEDQILSKSQFIETLKNKKGSEKMDISLNVDPSLKEFTTSVTSFGKIEIKRNPLKVASKQVVKAQRSIPTSSVFERYKLVKEKRISTKRSMITGCAILSETQIAMCYNSFSDCKIIFMNTEGNIYSETKVNNGSEYDIAYDDIDNTIIASRNFLSKAGFTVINADDGKEKHHIDLKRNINLGGVAVQNKIVICCTNKGVIKFEFGNEEENRVLVDKNIDTSCYVALNKNNIYFSNPKITGTVTCIDLSGSVKWAFKDDVLKCPSGIGVDAEGNVFVAGNQSDNVVVISPDGRRLRELLTKSDGINKPRAMCFNQKNNKLLVANSSDKNAFLFNVVQ